MIWLTGLSGSGKTTTAKQLVSEMHRNRMPTYLLDGDSVRQILDPLVTVGPEYDRERRLQLASTYSRLALSIAQQKINVVVSTISLFSEIHVWNRKNIPNYLEVYLKTPVEELSKRDPKGIYAKFQKGEINNVAGLDLAIDEPQNPDLLFEFETGQTPEYYAKTIFKLISKNDLQLCLQNQVSCGE